MTRKPPVPRKPAARKPATSAKDGAPELTDRQRQILDVIHAHLDEHGYPPSVREIGAAVGLASPSSVHSQLHALEEKGYLRRDPTKPRALEMQRDPETGLGAPASQSRNIPLIGDIAAGGPIIAEESVREMLPLPKDWVGEGTLFALTVRGESMIDAGVLDGDVIVVRQQPSVEQGDMCAALIDGEATVKFFRRTRGGEIFLDPANDAFSPIPMPPSADASIMGKVVSVFRTLR